jgi:hypothetical protein
MKNRSPLSIALDTFGIVALVGAGLALAGALWFAASLAEGLWLRAFGYCLMASTAGFVGARVGELVQLFAGATDVQGEIALEPLSDNVERLPSRLQRAA